MKTITIFLFLSIGMVTGVSAQRVPLTNRIENGVCVFHNSHSCTVRYVNHFNNGAGFLTAPAGPFVTPMEYSDGVVFTITAASRKGFTIRSSKKTSISVKWMAVDKGEVVCDKIAPFWNPERQICQNVPYCPKDGCVPEPAIANPN